MAVNFTLLGSPFIPPFLGVVVKSITILQMMLYLCVMADNAWWIYDVATKGSNVPKGKGIT